ncbi:MAG: hypothetical protein Q4A85_12065 [Kingella sp. (in: b-proteobacteria)]|nr:hypothetical protein [Kingella sp. (in: b-proteobacteria)]
MAKVSTQCSLKPNHNRLSPYRPNQNVGHPSDFFHTRLPCVAQIPITTPRNVNKLVAHANESLQSIHFQAAHPKAA